MDSYSVLWDFLHWRSEIPLWFQWLWVAVVFATLVAISWIDYKKMIIPNKITYPAILISIFLAPVLWTNWVTHIVFGICTFAFFILIFLWKGAGFGMGDLKMYTWAGIILAQGITICITISALAGIIIGIALSKKRGEPLKTLKIPHGPQIALGIGITILLDMLA